MDQLHTFVIVLLLLVFFFFLAKKKKKPMNSTCTWQFRDWVEGNFFQPSLKEYHIHKNSSGTRASHV
jgi:hypothetical protein